MLSTDDTSFVNRFMIYDEVYWSKNSILVETNYLIIFECIFLLIDIKTKLEMYLPMKVLIKVPKVIISISLVNEIFGSDELRS